MQRRNVGKDLKDVLDKCETDNGLSKTEIENEKELLKPLVNDFVKKTDNCLNALGERGRTNDDLIEDF